MSERQRTDLLGECNADAHPIDVFTTECCANCFNPECTRSLAGKLRFDQRVLGWYDRYFGEKDRMASDDPRFGKIAAQKFILLDPGLVGRAPEVGGTSAWIDPRELERPKVQERVVQLPTVQPTAKAPTVPAERPAAPGRKEMPHHLLLANSPAQPHQVIPARSVSPTTPARDPWTGPVPPPQSDVPVIQPGARVKLGGSGVS